MAKELPADTDFPNIEDDPDEMAAPGELFHDIDVEHTVKGQHFAMGYYGRCHCSQSWDGSTLIGQVRETSAAFVKKLFYFVVPRIAMTNGFEFRFRTLSDGGGTIRVRRASGAGFPVDTDVVVGAGLAYGTGTQALNLPDTLVHIEVWMKRDAAGSYINLYAFALWDQDLTVGTLP